MKYLFVIGNLFLASIACWYIYVRAFTPLIAILAKYTSEKTLKVIFKVLALLLALSSSAYFISMYYDSHLLSMATAYLMGILMVIFFPLFGFELSLLIARELRRRLQRTQSQEMSVIIKILATLWIVLGLIYASGSFYQGAKFPTVKKLTIPIKNLPYNEMKVVLLTDLHIGPFLKRDFVERLVAAVNELRPDAIFIVGDILDLNPTRSNSIANDLAPLGDLKARFGSFMVLGNHELYVGANEVVPFLRSLSPTLPLLINESVQIGEAGKKLNVVGLSEYAAKRFYIHYPELLPSLEKSKKGYIPGLPTIMLSHQPVQVKLLDPKEKPALDADLMLSGHTHGGQVFPFQLSIYFKQDRMLSGLYRYKKGNTSVYISEGAGFWGPPLRFFSSSEISLITLVPQ
ncbi:MAG: metallophosphoesterase [Oligoflexia bacterium]|nr:metallophosphoesterase [Oligoflexia bacterium]MBF0366886.1 metallophosphoesterase [Oligoflexia bacterium]